MKCENNIHFEGNRLEKSSQGVVYLACCSAVPATVINDSFEHLCMNINVSCWVSSEN